MDSLQTRINYHFRDGGLLTLALTHPSVAKAQSNQRLEFLGDSILGAIVARILYDLYPTEQEGELARRHAGLVRGETLTAVAREIGLGESMHIGISEQGGGRDNASNLEDALEALIGAIYLDGGMEAAEKFITPRWTQMARKIEAPPKDAKTSLQEWAQARGLPVPTYTIVETTGPAHAPEFTIEVLVQNCPPARAAAASKKLAEQLAAGMLLRELLE
jgi:ribonuclease-3